MKERSELLRLQRLEMSLVRAVIAQPSYLAEREYHRLRYAIGLARLYRFAPGAALQAPWRDEVTVSPEIVAPFRARFLAALEPALKVKGAQQRLREAVRALKPLRSVVSETRCALLQHHANDYGVDELDAEVGRKALVTIAGGGGGAGYVYIGASARLRKEGRSSDYLVGASIGSLIGAMLARSRDVDLDAMLAWAKSLRGAEIFGPPYMGRTHTLPGLSRLHLQAMHELLRHPDGSPLRLKDLEIPYDAVVAGVHQRAYAHLPASLRKLVSPPQTQAGLMKALAERMMMLVNFINPQVTQPIVLGRTADTGDIRVADAVGLSAAIPGVLQYEPPERDSRTDAVLNALREAERVALLVDGGVAANVPARIAWEGVHAGRIGTRNAFFLALDCFAPQSDPRHLWLWPVTQAVQAQLPAQRPYFDWLLSFKPTLSPVNLLPAEPDFDRAYRWGWEQADELVPFLLKALEPVRWID